MRNVIYERGGGREARSWRRKRKRKANEGTHNKREKIEKKWKRKKKHLEDRVSPAKRIKNGNKEIHKVKRKLISFVSIEMLQVKVWVFMRLCTKADCIAVPPRPLC